MANNLATLDTSKIRTVEIQRDSPTVVIGERLNPTGRKRLSNELKEGMFEIVKKDSLAQVEAGVRESVKVLVGGAPVTQDFADQIGADGYASNAASASDLAKEITA